MQPQATHPNPLRPRGVSILAAVSFLGGVFGIFGAALALSGIMGEPLALGAVVLVFGVLGILLGIGFVRGMSWSWTVGVSVYVLSIPLGIWEIALGGSGSVGGVVSVVVGLVVLYYLTRPRVKAFFGRNTPPTASG